MNKKLNCPLATTIRCVDKMRLQALENPLEAYPETRSRLGRWELIVSPNNTSVAVFCLDASRQKLHISTQDRMPRPLTTALRVFDFAHFSLLFFFATLMSAIFIYFYLLHE